MKIHEMQEKLENLGSNLLIISETAGAIEVSLNSEVLSVNQVGWALTGIVRGLEKAANDVDEIVKGSIDICKRLETL